MENIQLTNLRKAKLILEAEIDRIEKGGRTEIDIAEESMQLLQNGLSCQDYETIEQLQSQGKLDFNNFAIDRVFKEVEGHEERCKAVLDYLMSRIHFFMEQSIGDTDYTKIAEYSDTIFTLARIAINN